MAPNQEPHRVVRGQSGARIEHRRGVEPVERLNRPPLCPVNPPVEHGRSGLIAEHACPTDPLQCQPSGGLTRVSQ